MNHSSYEFGLYVFMLAAFLGWELVKRVSPLLHTPLMSLSNAISAIAVVGAIALTGEKDASPRSRAVLGVRRACRRHPQRRQRLSHHGPDAQDVPQAGTCRVQP